MSSISGLGRSTEEGTGHPLQYSCLGNPMDREAWWATVHGVARIGHELVTISPLPHHNLLNFLLSLTILSFPVCFDDSSFSILSLNNGTPKNSFLRRYHDVSSLNAKYHLFANGCQFHISCLVLSNSYILLLN